MYSLWPETNSPDGLYARLWLFDLIYLSIRGSKMKSNNSVLKIRPEALSPKSLALISEFALILYRLNGTIIEVSSSKAVIEVFAHAAHTGEPRLREICKSLRADLISKFSASNVMRQLDQGDRRSSLRH